jgi:hypothetical protein
MYVHCHVGVFFIPNTPGAFEPTIFYTRGGFDGQCVRIYLNMCWSIKLRYYKITIFLIFSNVFCAVFQFFPMCFVQCNQAIHGAADSDANVQYETSHYAETIRP